MENHRSKAKPTLMDIMQNSMKISFFYQNVMYSGPPPILDSRLHLFADFSVEHIYTLFVEKSPIRGIFNRKIFTNCCIFI